MAIVAEGPRCQPWHWPLLKTEGAHARSNFNARVVACRRRYDKRSGRNTPGVVDFFDELIERATAVRLPAIYHWPEAADAGGLLGYGPRFSQVWRQRAQLVIKI